jgi:hypothetical protein
MMGILLQDECSGWAWSFRENDMQMKAILKELPMMGILFLSVEKKLNDSHSLNFTGFIPQIVEGIRQMS